MTPNADYVGYCRDCGRKCDDPYEFAFEGADWLCRSCWLSKKPWRNQMDRADMNAQTIMDGTLDYGVLPPEILTILEKVRQYEADNPGADLLASGVRHWFEMQSEGRRHWGDDLMRDQLAEYDNPLPPNASSGTP